MVTTRPPKTIVKPTALGPVANTDTKLLIYGLFQKGRVLAQDGVQARAAPHLDQNVLARCAAVAPASVLGPLETRARTNDEIMPAWSRQTGD